MLFTYVISKFIQNTLFFINMLRRETKEAQNSYSWSSQSGKSKKIRAFLKKKNPEWKHLWESFSFLYTKIIPASGYLIGQKHFLLLKRASTVWKWRVSVLVSMQLVLMTVPFLPVFAVVHPPVKQTKPYEVQQCSVLTQASLSGLLFLLAHLPSPRAQKGKCLRVWQGKRKAPAWRAWEYSRHFVTPTLAFPTKRCLRNEHRNSILMRCHNQELGNLCDG